MFKKILFPVDGSEYSKRATLVVSELAKKYNSEVILLHSHYIPFLNTPPLYISNKEFEKIVLEPCQKLLNKTKEKFEEAGIYPICSLKSGNIKETIIKTADEEN